MNTNCDVLKQTLPSTIEETLGIISCYGNKPSNTIYTRQVWQWKCGVKVDGENLSFPLKLKKILLLFSPHELK